MHTHTYSVVANNMAFLLNHYIRFGVAFVVILSIFLLFYGTELSLCSTPTTFFLAFAAHQPSEHSHFGLSVCSFTFSVLREHHLSLFFHSWNERTIFSVDSRISVVGFVCVFVWVCWGTNGNWSRASSWSGSRCVCVCVRSYRYY